MTGAVILVRRLVPALISTGLLSLAPLTAEAAAPCGKLADLENYAAATEIVTWSNLLVTADAVGVSTWSAPEHWLGSWIGPALPISLTVTDAGLAVAVFRDDGLYVVDVSTPASPRLVAELGAAELGGLPRAVAAVGEMVVVTGGSAFGLRMLDLTTSSAPVPRGELALGAWAGRVAASGTLAVVAGGGAGVYVVDITDPDAPRLGSTVPTSTWATHVALNGDGHAVVGEFQEGGGGSTCLEVVEIPSPGTAYLRGGVDTQMQVLGLAVAGASAVLTEGYDDLHVIDLTDPDAPFIRSALDNASCAPFDRVWHGVAARGIDAVVVATDWGPMEVSLADPDHPSSACPPGRGEAQGVAVAGSLAVVADGMAGVRVVDLAADGGPRIVGRLPTIGPAASVALADGLAWVGLASTGLIAVDLANPAQPTVVASYSGLVSSSAEGLAVSNGYAWVAGNVHGVDVLDVSNPAAIQYLDRAVLPSGAGYAAARMVVTDGSVAWVAASEAGVCRLAVDPGGELGAPSCAATDSPAQDIARSGTVAWVAARDVLRFDLATALPSLEQTITMPAGGAAMDVSVAGGRAVAAGHGFAVWGWDPSDPEDPPVASRSAARMVYDLTADDNTVYALARPFLQVLDHATDAAPGAAFSWSADRSLVSFTDLSVGAPTTWSWSLGDGSQAFGANPVHLYAAEGDYQVTLEVCNCAGCDSVLQTVTIDLTPIFADGFETGGLERWSAHVP